MLACLVPDMHFSMESEQSLREPKRQAPFSPLPTSTPLLSFDVLEWIPRNSEFLGRRSSGSAAPDYFPDSRACAASREGRTLSRDCTAFESSCGWWICFQTLSCRGDVLVLEDAQFVDVGAARRREFTWQQGPGRLLSGGLRTGCSGASADFWQTLASVSENATKSGADMVPRDTLLVDRRCDRPAHPPQRHKREIPMQAIHSIRRHCFQTPLTLAFDANGHAVSGRDSCDTTAHDKHAKWLLQKNPSQHSSGSERVLNLQWRYELWGPVGVIFTLRGGRCFFLAFASIQHAERIEERLRGFDSKSELSCRQRSGHSAHRRSCGTSAYCSRVPLWSAGDDIPFDAGVRGPFVTPLSSGALQRGTSPSGFSVRIAPCEASSRGLSATPWLSRAGTALSSTWASGAHWSVSSSPAGLHTGEEKQRECFARKNSAALLADTVTVTQEVGGAVTVSACRGSGKAPGSGYLYCRPWGEASRYRRYYLRMCTTARGSRVVHLSRHRSSLWKRLRQFFGHEKRSVLLDPLHTFVSPSAAHENLLRVTYEAKSFAKYKSMRSLGGGVASLDPVNNVSASSATRRRELELNAGDTLVLEALVTSPEDRTSWLAWFRSCGATVQAPVDAAEVRYNDDGVLSPKKLAACQHLVGEPLLTTSHVSIPVQEMLTSSTADQYLSTWVTPTSAEAWSSLKSPVSGSPHLPLKEHSEGRRGGILTSVKTAESPQRSFPCRMYPSTAFSLLPEPLPVAEEHAPPQTPPQPPSAVASDTRDCQEEEEELTILVDSDELDRRTPCQEAFQRHSWEHTMYSDTSVLDNTTPPRRTYSLPLLDEGAPLRWGSGTRVVNELNTVASAGESSKTDHMLANSRPTMAVPIVAPVYLEDTTSTEVSTHERSNELTQQPSTATSNSVPLSSHFPRTYVLQDCSNEHNELKPSKTHRGASRTPQCHTAASQGVVGAPFSPRLLDKAGPRTPVATSDGSAVLVPLKAPTTVVASSFVAPGGHSRKCGSSDSVHSPPRTSEAETPVFRTEGLESWVAGLQQRTWRTSNRSISPDALLNAPSLAARLNHPEKPVHTSKQLSSTFEARSTSSPGMMVQQPYHTHGRARFFEEKHATGDTSASCPEALASRETLDNGDRGTEDLQISDASSSFSVGDCSSLPSLTSTVDPRLSQLLEPCVNKKSPGQVGGQHRGCGTSVGVCL